uniref:Uncharacterized protein n=1 Tax=Arion vulgaris TaxID=1028688 RepID=A0A0B7AUB5_9EUPU
MCIRAEEIVALKQTWLKYWGKNEPLNVTISHSEDVTFKQTETKSCVLIN